MKLLLASLILAINAQAAITLIAHASAKGGSTTASIDTTGATLIVISATDFGSDFPLTNPVSDNKSNTWTTAYTSSRRSCINGLSEQAYFYVIGGTVGTGHTFTYTSSTGSLEVTAFAGVLSFDAVAGPTNPGANTTFQWGSLTPANAGSLVLSSALIVNSGGVTAPSVNSSFIIIETAFDGSTFGGTLAYLIETTIVAANPTWTFNVSNSSCGANIVFAPTVSSSRIRHKVTE